MEHFESPYRPSDFVSSRAVENRAFFHDTIIRAKAHRFFSHPFMTVLDDTTPSPEVVAFILTSFYKIVSPFTGLLCTLGGRAPDLRSRFALMDNIYEEMGRGNLAEAHPSLYLRMLASIGVSARAAEAQRTLPSIRRINDHLHEVVERRTFAVACAVLASAEATIPPSFPVLAKMARKAFPDVDMGFFDRHGPRDEGHSDDAAMLFSVTADSSDYATVETEVRLDLDYRVELFDEWMEAIRAGAPVHVAASDRPPRYISERPPRRPSVRPGGSVSPRR